MTNAQSTLILNESRILNAHIKLATYSVERFFDEYDLHKAIHHFAYRALNDPELNEYSNLRKIQIAHNRLHKALVEDMMEIHFDANDKSKLQREIYLLYRRSIGEFLNVEVRKMVPDFEPLTCECCATKAKALMK